MIRCGFGMPVTTQVPSISSEWEKSAGPEEVIAVAQAADRLGFHHLTTSHHVAVPSERVDDYAKSHGSHFWDPVAAFALMAGHTERIRFLPYCYVIGFAHPLELAKSFGTVDLISDGRLILGFGVGNYEIEFDTLGKEFADRGRVADDTLRALRATLGRREVSYQGEYHSYSDFVVSPHSVQQPVPMWIAGHSKRALRRAVELGEGWMPTPAGHGGPDDETVTSMLSEHHIPDDFEVLLSPGGPLDPIDDAAGTRQLLDQAEAGPATLINVRFEHRSCEHLIEQMEAFTDIAGLS